LTISTEDSYLQFAKQCVFIDESAIDPYKFNFIDFRPEPAKA
jgi:hypothetical protein